jgi:dTDP-4-dehydrorhamnose 3,5-epimerase
MPTGFARGCLVLVDGTEFVSIQPPMIGRPSSSAILWNEPALARSWPLDGDALLPPKGKEDKPFPLAEVFE